MSGRIPGEYFPRVAGYCPMGCGQTLMLGEGGFVTCSLLACPDPSAVATILDDGETEHVVKFERSTFTVRHPLRERLGDRLMACELHNEIAGMIAAVMMDGWHAPDNPDHNFAGDLKPAAEQWCRYLVSQLQRLNEPRGGDLFLSVVLQRGAEQAGHEYREGRFVKEESA